MFPTRLSVYLQEMKAIVGYIPLSGILVFLLDLLAKMILIIILNRMIQIMLLNTMKQIIILNKTKRIMIYYYYNYCLN